MPWLVVRNPSYFKAEPTSENPLRWFNLDIDPCPSIQAGGIYAAGHEYDLIDCAEEDE